MSECVNVFWRELGQVNGSKGKTAQAERLMKGWGHETIQHMKVVTDNAEVLECESKRKMVSGDYSEAQARSFSIRYALESELT